MKQTILLYRALNDDVIRDQSNGTHFGIKGLREEELRIFSAFLKESKDEAEAGRYAVQILGRNRGSYELFDAKLNKLIDRAHRGGTTTCAQNCAICTQLEFFKKHDFRHYHIGEINEDRSPLPAWVYRQPQNSKEKLLRGDSGVSFPEKNIRAYVCNLLMHYWVAVDQNGDVTITICSFSRHEHASRGDVWAGLGGLGQSHLGPLPSLSSPAGPA